MTEKYIVDDAWNLVFNIYQCVYVDEVNSVTQMKG